MHVGHQSLSRVDCLKHRAELRSSISFMPCYGKGNRQSKRSYHFLTFSPAQNKTRYSPPCNRKQNTCPFAQILKRSTGKRDPRFVKSWKLYAVMYNCILFSQHYVTVLMVFPFESWAEDLLRSYTLRCTVGKYVFKLCFPNILRMGHSASPSWKQITH